jgi:hypothetical protein
VAQILVQLPLQDRVPFAPEDDRRDVDARIRQHARALPERLSIVIDRGARGAGAQERRPVHLDVVIGEGIATGGAAAKGRRDGGGMATAEEPLGQARELEEEHVAALQHLRRVAAGMAGECRRMRCVQHRQRADNVRAAPCELPRDDTAPVVADNVRAFLAERMDECQDIIDERLDVVAAGRLVGEVVAAEVGRHGAEAGFSERGQLVAPRVPALGEAVEKQHERAFALFGDVEADAVRFEEGVP